MPKPGRGAAFAALLQAAITVILMALIGTRWWPIAVVGGMAVLLQALHGLRLLRGLEATSSRAWAAGMSLAFAALIAGAYLQALLHIHATFTEVGAGRASQFVAAIGLGAPYLLTIPIWQAYTARRLGKKALAAGLLLALIPFTEGPDGVTRVSPQDHASWTTYAWSLWNGEAAVAPESAHGQVLITPVRAGELGRTQSSDWRSLDEAIQAALPDDAPTPQSALIIEFVVAESSVLNPILGTRVAAVQAGQTALQYDDAVQSAVALLREPHWTRTAPAPGVFVPAFHENESPAPTQKLRVEAWLVNALENSQLSEGWQTGPALSAHAALTSAVAGGDYLLRNQAEDGRFNYIVRGPSGEATKGYNYPRHAGTTWFLSRLAARTGEARFRTGAERGINYLVAHSKRVSGDRAYVLDPARKDGKAWVGTTALAALAANRVGDVEWAALWGNHVAASVDEQGQIRGNYRIEDDSYPAQDTITYGQGQGLLALAALHSDGQTSLAPALNRASAYVDGAYFSRPGSTLLTLDEHWTCIASLATLFDSDNAVGTSACHAYLANQRFNPPGRTASLAPGTAAAGGLVEALAAAARLSQMEGEQGGWWLRQAEQYSQHFLNSQYQGSDALLLPKPESLMGGYRNRPWDLDVQIDTVQHIGSALLGIEALLSGKDLPGSWS